MIKECRVCKKQFNASGRALTCSPECARINRTQTMKKWETANKQHVKEYRSARKDHFNYLSRKYDAAHPEMRKKIRRKNYLAHREERLAMSRQQRSTPEYKERKNAARRLQTLEKNRLIAQANQTELAKFASDIPFGGDKWGEARVKAEQEKYNQIHIVRLTINKCKCTRCGHEFVVSKGNTSHVLSLRLKSGCSPCPWCGEQPIGGSQNNQKSTPEREIQKLFPEFSVAHWRPDWMEGKEIDLYAPEYNVALEYDGIKWHSGVTKADRRKYAAKHIEKTDLCEKHGIQLIHLFETEWLNSRDCVIDKLSAIFHRPMERYMARKCYTQVVESGTTEFNKCRDEVVAFLNRNHIQGAGTSGSCRVMLRDKATGELRAVCCFQNRHGRSKATEEEWDLCRYATALGTTVAGGITKCISAFKGAHPECKVLTSLADRRWTSTLRSAYSSSGFEWDGEPAHADYFYVVKRDGRPRLVNKSGYQLKFIDREFPETFIEGADNTEWARMERAGVPYIYDCGKLKYVMKLG